MVANYDRELKVAMSSAIEAGKEILKYFKKDFERKIKEDGSYVTEADIASQRIIINKIKEIFPNDGIISEENEINKNERTWFIDPLDGTRSFIEGEPDFTVHIGLCVANTPVVGVVYQPVTGDIFYGSIGNGAYKIDKNNKKERLASIKNGSCPKIVVTTNSKKESIEIKQGLELLGINEKTKAGCTGLRLMRLVENKADVFMTYTKGLGFWDVCAPEIILKEAGCVIGYLDGSEIEYQKKILPNFFVIGAKNYEYFNQIKKGFLINKIDVDFIDKEIKEDRAKNILGSQKSAKRYLINYEGKDIFYKDYILDEEEPLRDEYVKFFTLPAVSYQEKSTALEQSIIEASKLMKWKSLGIDTPEVVFFTPGKIAYKYMSGVPFKEKVRNVFDFDMFELILDSYHNIRKIAKENRENSILHTDPHPENFFYDEDRKKIIPIDSSKKARNNLDFEELDARINLFFLYKLFKMEVSLDIVKKCLSLAVNRLTKEEKEYMRKINFMTQEQKDYLEKNKESYSLKNRIFFDEEIMKIINRELEN